MAEHDHLVRAEVLLELRRPEQAEQLLTDLLAGDPSHAGALRLLSRVHRLQQRRDELPRAAEQAVAAAPQDGRGWEELARALSECGRRAEAVDAAERALGTAPQDPGLRVLLAALLVGIDDRRALELADLALTVDPDSAPAHAVRARALEALGRGQEAMAAVGEAVRLAPEDEYTTQALAFHLSMRGRRDDAAGALHRGLAADPRSTALQDDLRWEESLGRALPRLRTRAVVALVVLAGCLVCLLTDAPWWVRAALLAPVLVLDLRFWFRDGLWREAAALLDAFRRAPAGLRHGVLADRRLALGLPVLLLLVVPYAVALLPARSAGWAVAAGVLLALATFVLGVVTTRGSDGGAGPDPPAAGRP